MSGDSRERLDGPTSVPLDELNVDMPLRTPVEAHVRVLAGVLERCPPVLVDRPSLRVVDGHMRVAAALRRGWREIPVRWVDGSDAELLEMAVATNAAHGLPLTRLQRLDAVAALLAAAPGWSNRRIAAVAGVSEATVRRRRRPGASSAQVDGAADSVVGRDGKVYPLGDGGRDMATRLLRESPRLSDREVARRAGISPTTVGALRRRARATAPAPGTTRSWWVRLLVGMLSVLRAVLARPSRHERGGAAVAPQGAREPDAAESDNSLARDREP